MPRRSAAALVTRQDGTTWRRTRRRCKQCRHWFLPRIEQQAFCPGRLCRDTWWQERIKEMPHKCRCKAKHRPRKPAKKRTECAWAKVDRLIIETHQRELRSHRQRCEECRP